MPVNLIKILHNAGGTNETNGHGSNMFLESGHSNVWTSDR